MRHVYECPLRWADMDALGHVNNVRYVDYLQEARADMLRVHTGATAGEDLTEGVVVVRHDLEFLTPLVFRAAPVRIETWATQVGAASFTLAYEVLDLCADGRRTVYTRATTRLSPYVFASERPRRLTETEREVLAAFRDEARW